MLNQLGVLSTNPNAPAARPVMGALNAEIQRQVTTLTTIDEYIITGALTVVLLVALAVIPTRTYPPRIALAWQ